MIKSALLAFMVLIGVLGGDFSETDHLISEMADRATVATDFTPN